MSSAKDESEQGPERFFKIPAAIASSGLLRLWKPSELRVYLTLCSFANYRNGACFPNIGQIREISGVNKNEICTATRRLMELGVIIKKRAPRSFKFKNVYTIVRSPQIDPSFLPSKKEKRSRKVRGKDGRWGVIPSNTESDIIPRTTESIFLPGKTEHKEIELEVNRDSFKSNPIPISKKTKEEVEKVKGKKYVQDQIDAGLYVIIEDPVLEDSGKEHE